MVTTRSVTISRMEAEAHVIEFQHVHDLAGLAVKGSFDLF
jgi:hypothetical protein